MKEKPRFRGHDHTDEKKAKYMPVRYIAAFAVTALAAAAAIGIVLALCRVVPYFYLLAWAAEIGCVIRIMASDDNPDEKIPWLLLVLAVPVAGFVLYFLFYSRKRKNKYVRRLQEIKNSAYVKEDAKSFKQLAQEDPLAHSQARMLCSIAGTHLFCGTAQTYFPMGEDVYPRMLEDLRRAEEFIFLEFFIIEAGKFWNSVLEILKEKAAAGLDVRVVYDDVGCMTTLPGNYARQLEDFGIQATPFSRMGGKVDSELSNRGHRKILVIDGRVGYTGGFNLADEYINAIKKYGTWKDSGLRLEGEAVWELTKLFFIDFGLNVKHIPPVKVNCFPACRASGEPGYLVPFGDGPHPVYTRRVGKSVIKNMLCAATRYAYITTPYLIIDNDMCQSLENAALRGVDVRIIVPHIPDKRIIFEMTRSFYPRLMSAGVRIYEYTPGFMHAKNYLADDVYAMVGSVNLDYRSLVHHFENGVWMYRCESIQALKADMENTLKESEEIVPQGSKDGVIHKAICAVVRIVAPMM